MLSQKRSVRPWISVWSVLVLAGASMTVHAQNQGSSTLDKIQRTGVFALGHRESSLPFSYYGENQKVVGYSQDFAEAVVQAVKTQLNKPDLQVTLTPITSQNRISLLQNGTIDLECGSTSNSKERLRQVSFSNSLFVVEPRLMVKRNSRIKDFGDLRGKTVVTTAGTTSERILRGLKQSRGLPQNIISVKDHGEAFLTLETGRAVAFMMDDALLAGERAKSKNSAQYQIVGSLASVGFPRSREAYGCMLRKNDPAFKALVDQTIADLQRSGKANQLYQKWFLSPIAPNHLNLNFPQGAEVRALFANPNDRTLD